MNGFLASEWFSEDIEPSGIQHLSPEILIGSYRRNDEQRLGTENIEKSLDVFPGAIRQFLFRYDYREGMELHTFARFLETARTARARMKADQHLRKKLMISW